MLAYIIRRLLLIVPTLIGIIAINFVIVQVAPGGPIEQILAQVRGEDAGVEQRIGVGGASGASESGAGGGGQQTQSQRSSGASDRYRGAQGLDPEFIADLEKQFGFDKPLHERFFLMLGNYLTLDFGESYYQNRSVLALIGDKLPVSISLGVWATLLSYLIGIPLGIGKAVRDGSRFDIWTSGALVVGTAIPNFVFALLLIVLFAGGSYFSVFPLRGLVSDNWSELGLVQQVLDYFWHITLPVFALLLGSFTTLTLLTKNSFIDQINQQYVQTARAKGLTERRVLYGHVFRNSMLIVIAGFPGAFISMFFAGSVLIESIFTLDGLGLMGLEAVFRRDYPIIFGTLFIFTLLGMVVQLISDLTYTLVDPRIDFEARG
jgi:microcin C transport system permease protein